MRLTVGAVNARTGAMRYFDSKIETLAAEHVMASGALPPAFPAVRIVHLWNPSGTEPKSIWEVLGRQKV